MHFYRDERTTAKSDVLLLGGSRLAQDPKLDAWVAMVIESEPANDCARRQGANSDREVKKTAARLRQQKHGVSEKLAEALTRYPVVANTSDHEVLTEEVAILAQSIWGGPTRKEVPETE